MNRKFWLTFLCIIFVSFLVGIAINREKKAQAFEAIDPPIFYVHDTRVNLCYARATVQTRNALAGYAYSPLTLVPCSINVLRIAMGVK